MYPIKILYISYKILGSSGYSKVKQMFQFLTDLEDGV